MTRLIVNHENVEALPIKHLSVSAIREFLTNRQSFYKKYVRLEFNFKTGVSLLRGKAVHAALEYYRGEKIGDPTKIPNEDIMRDIAIQNLQDAVKKEGDNMDRGKTGSLEKTIEDVNQAITNYLRAVPNYIPLGVEVKETVNFVDLDGDMMPLALKGVLDLPAETPDGDPIIVDHKVVSVFIDDDVEAGAYEIQAGAYYLIYQAITGKRPKKMIFDQIPYNEPEAGKGLLQPQLRQLCEDSGLGREKYETNAKLKEKLLAHGLIEPPVYRQPYVIDYDEKPYVVNLFLEVYKRVVNELGVMSFYDLPLEFLPNPFDRMSGQDSWDDFKQEVDSGRTRRDLVEATTGEIADDINPNDIDF